MAVDRAAPCHDRRDPDSIVAGLERLHDRLAAHVERGAVPALVALVACGADVHAEVLGHAALDDPAPLRRDAIFRIASLTKPIAAAGAMALVDDGVLSLGDPGRVLPARAGRPARAAQPGERAGRHRPRRALHHGGGPADVPARLRRHHGAAGRLSGPGRRGGARADDPGSALAAPPFGSRRVDQALRHAAPLGPAGCRLALQHRCARAGGPAGAGERAAPRGIPAGSPVRAARHGGHVVQRPGGEAGSLHDGLPCRIAATGALEVLDPPVGGWWSEPPAMANAAGMLVSTIDDLWAFVSMLLSEGRHEGEQLLSPASVADMTRDHLTAAQRASATALPRRPRVGLLHGSAARRCAASLRFRGVSAGTAGRARRGRAIRCAASRASCSRRGP